MTAKLFEANHITGKFSINVNDEEKTEWGVVKSVTYTPANPTGQFDNVGINELFAVKVAAFNAMSYHYFGLYEATPGLHIYAENNSRKLDGGIGWINLLHYMNVKDSHHESGVAFSLDSKEVTSILNLNGQYVFVEWPSRVAWEYKGVFYFKPVEGGKRTKVTTMGDYPWARLVGNGANQVKVALESPDEKGNFPGNLLHSKLELLYTGWRIMLPATNKRFTNFQTKESVMLTKIQDRVAWLLRALTTDGYEYQAHKDTWVADRILFATTQRIHEQVKQDVEVTDGTNAKTILDARANGEKTGLVILVDGKKVDLGAFKAGIYNVFTSDGKQYGSRPVALAKTGGMDLLNRFRIKGYKLETVSVYAK